MSMFLCAKCDEMRDSDDGCEETPDRQGGLICIDCMNEDDDGEPLQRGMSYDGIYQGLLKLGCPEDIARELAREKCR